MPLWGLSGWSDSVNKRMCRFLIHRYLGHLLKEKLSLEQLSVDLYNGTGTIQDVNVDVEYVNEILETLKVPIRLVDGYIGEITAAVPWAQLLNDSCLMEIKRLEVTIQPLKGVKTADLQPDLVSSMIESVMGSLASSMELAKSFLNEAQGAEETEREAEEGGVEAFAQIIDAVMSRMRLVFVDTVIRLENPPRGDSTLSSAVELQIDRIEFLDEQLEACQQQGTSKDTITTQPHSLYAIPDLNKILNLHGVRLYTDVFSRPEASDFPSMSGSSQVFTSMYVRRQEKAQKKSSSASPPSPTDEMAHSSVSTTNFQSCYSHLASSISPSALADDLDSLSMTQSNSVVVGADTPAKLASDPIQFAAFTGEKQTIRLRLRNNALSPASERCVNNKVDVQMFLGGLAVFLTPSQLFILQSVIEKLLLPSTDNSLVDPKKCGKPMQQTDFARVEHQLQGDMEAKALWRTDFSSGNWSGEEKFFDTSRKPTLGIPGQPTASDMSSVILDSNGPSIATEQSSRDNELRKVSRDSLSSPRSPSHDVKPEVTHIKARLSNFWLTLTHKDPMSSGSGANDLSASVETIRAWSDHFFQSSSAVSYSARTNLKDIRSACDTACSLDQLRFIGCPLVFDYTIERGFNAEAVVMNISAANCEFLECLSPSSVEAAESDGMTHVELATFAAHSSDDGWAAEEVPNFCLRLANRDGLPHYNISLELSPCRTQLDPSMVDRICHLTHCRPAFLSSAAAASVSQRTVVASTGSVSSLELKEDLFMTAVASKNSADTLSTLEVDVRCADWTIELSIPVADLRDHTAALARPPWWMRRVRDEALVLQLKNARVKLPKFDPSVMDAQGLVKITCSKAIGSLIGDPEVLRCDSSTQQFLFASGAKDSQCSVTLKWDMRNKSLRAEQNASPDGDMATSSWGSFFRMPSSGIDGPFSRKVVMHENEELTIVGSRQEMSDFGRKCLQNTDLCVEIDVPVLRLQLPSKQFYEVVYNRLVNDLALWEPSSPAYRASVMSQTGFDIHVAGLDVDPRFQLCRSTAAHRDSDDESDDESVRTLQEKTRGPSHRTTANKFSLLLNTGSARILVGASCLEDNIMCGNSELAIEAGGGELFVVTGYQGDPNVVYFFVSLGFARLWHQNLLGEGVRHYPNDVTTDIFAKPAKGDLKAEPTAENVALCKLVDDDNVAVALRIILRPKDNSKDILAAIGIRNTTVHMHPFADPGHFWITQLIDFFDVPDYPIAGYELPKITTELHVHAASSTVSYDHACVKAGSPLKLRLVLGSCDVSSRIVQQFAVMKLQCLFEEAKLYMCAKPARERHVNFDRQQVQQTLGPDDFVCLMRMGLFDLEVTVAEEMMLNDEQKASMPNRKINEDTPMMEIKCRNDVLKIWTCADSLVMLVNAAIEIAESDLIAKPVQKFEEQAPPPRPELTPLVEHQLEQMVKSAMLHTVGTRSEIASAGSLSSRGSARSSDSMGREALLAAAIDEALHHPQERVNSCGSDEDFCIVDEIPGSGIMLPSGEPRVRKLSDSGIDIAENHFMAPQQRSNPLTKLPHGYPQPLIRYLMRDFSVLLHLYGGADFASACEAKSYSTGESRQGKGQGQRVEADAQGGPNRDHSVVVEMQMTKMCFLFEMFGGNAPALARHLLTVQDVEVRDRLTASQINKMLYQYASGQRPRRTCAPMMAVRLLETHNGEGKLKMSMLPLRLNFDQDTLEFLQDFGAELSAGIQLPVKNKSSASLSSEPIMEVPNHLAESPPQFASAPPAEPELPVPLPPSMEDSVSTLAGLFAEDEPAITDSVHLFTDFTPSTGGVRFVKSPSNDREWAQELKSSSSSSSNTIATSQSGPSVSAPSPAGGETFFKHFSFSPSVTIRLDYQGKRVKTDQGAVLGLLIGLSQLHCTELHLKELHNRQGLLGLGRCVQYALNEWVVDIRRNQLPQVVGSYGPISSLVQIAQGIRDLFLMPVDEYRKVDGHVVKGIQRGAESFGVSTAAAAVEITQRMVGLVQGVAEFAFDIVTPEYPPPPARRRYALLQLVKQPNDFREGLHMAYDAVREGVVDTAEVLHLAAQEDRAQGRWPLRGLLRQATPTVLRPIVVASRATGHVLGGLRSQLRPDTHREELDKWRQQTT